MLTLTDGPVASSVLTLDAANSTTTNGSLTLGNGSFDGNVVLQLATTGIQYGNAPIPAVINQGMNTRSIVLGNASTFTVADSPAVDDFDVNGPLLTGSSGALIKATAKQPAHAQWDQHLRRRHHSERRHR